MEPVFQSGERLITLVDGPHHGRYDRTWVTDRGLHVKQAGITNYIPYNSLSGIVSTGVFRQKLFSRSMYSPTRTLEFYKGFTRVSSISIDTTSAMRVKEVALESKLKSVPRSGPTKVLDESKLIGVVNSNMEVKGGFLSEKVERLTKRGIAGIEKFLGEAVYDYGGKYHQFRGYYSDPEFLSKHWIIEIKDYDPRRNSGVSVVSIYRPDIVFFFADLLWMEVTSHSSGTPGGRFSTGSPGSTDTSYFMQKDSSSVTLYTRYGKKQFTPFNVFEYSGSRVADLVWLG